MIFFTTSASERAAERSKGDPEIIGYARAIHRQMYFRDRLVPRNLQVLLQLQKHGELLYRSFLAEQNRVMLRLARPVDRRQAGGSWQWTRPSGRSEFSERLRSNVICKDGG
jgi:hypothetical protein